MINYIVGDLVRDSEMYDVIVHGCNCFCTMGSGFAPQIKNKYPETFVVDCETKKGDKDKLGTFSYTKIQTKPTIVNLYSQYHFNGRNRGEMDADYNAIRTGMKAIKKMFGGQHIAMPKLGANLAGGDWNVIERIIEEELSGELVTVVVWEQD